MAAPLPAALLWSKRVLTNAESRLPLRNTAPPSPTVWLPIKAVLVTAVVSKMVAAPPALVALLLRKRVWLMVDWPKKAAPPPPPAVLPLSVTFTKVLGLPEKY